MPCRRDYQTPECGLYLFGFFYSWTTDEGFLSGEGTQTEAPTRGDTPAEPTRVRQGSHLEIVVNYPKPRVPILICSCLQGFRYN